MTEGDSRDATSGDWCGTGWSRALDWAQRLGIMTHGPDVVSITE